MKQALRILIIYLIVIGLAYALLHFLPFKINPHDLNFSDKDKIITNQQDSAEILSLLAQDSLLTDTIDFIPLSEIEKDTVIANNFLSCPSSFIRKLKVFDEHLSTMHRDKKVLRVLHFGDSQIEGDRITAYLREAFQERFGGSGPGLNAVLDLQRMNPSIWLDNGDNWELKSIYDRKRDTTKNTYGLMGQYAYLPKDEDGMLKISRSPWAESHASNYQSIRLFIAPHKGDVTITGTIKNTEVINDTLQSSVNLTEINWSFPQVSPSLRMDIKSSQDIAVLGCALDSTSGIAVDNIALRGQSSPLLHRTDADLFRVMGEHLNISMIILQFGTNMIPMETSNYGFYKKILAKQFDMLIEFLPERPVLFIGIGDAAKSDDGKIESYNHLKELRNAQKELALEYGFAYFDMFEAMGGKGSIIDWTKANPPLALTDYVHFSRLGGQKAAGFITKALWHEFDQFHKLPDSTLVKSDTLNVWNK